MSQTRDLVHKLSKNEFIGLVSFLNKSEAIKSVTLLKLLRDNKSDDLIKEKLGLSKNAYYTLNSRLTEKIEDYIINNSKNPRAVLVRKATAINDILLNRNKTVAKAALTKLEKELKSYDMTNELIQVYRALKKLTLNEPKNFEYTQLYNRQMALVVAMDKVEDSVSDYFRRYNEKLTTYNIEEEFSFDVILDELASNYGIYGSHRMYVYYSLVNIFHSIFNSGTLKFNEIEEVFVEVDRLFVSYQLDTSYQFLRWVFKYLRLLFFFRLDPNHRGIGKLLMTIKDEQERLASNGYMFTFVGYYFNVRLKYWIHNSSDYDITLKDLSEVEKYDLTFHSLSNYYLQQSFLIVGYVQLEQKQKALDVIDKLYKTSNIKAYTELYLEFRLIQAWILKDGYDYNGMNVKVLSSIKRHIKKVNDVQMNYAEALYDYLFYISTDGKRESKILELSEKFNQMEKPLHAPLFAIQL